MSIHANPVTVRKFFSLFVIILVSFLTRDVAVAATVPANFEVRSVVAGLNIPTAMAFAPDGRIFVTEKNGAVRIVKNGLLLPTPLVKLSAVNSFTDRGLLGIAIDPEFATNGYIYLSYTYENTPGQNVDGLKTGRIVRLTVVGDTADESSMVVLVGKVSGNALAPSCINYSTSSDCIASDSPSHSMGALHFGPDGKLWATLGDGAHYEYADWRSLRAQDVNALAGKILRINTDGTGVADNPFYNGDPNANRSKVWAYGLRNSFRFNFRPGTTTLYAGDVGWTQWEEINVAGKGANFGWPCREGFLPTEGGLGCSAVNYSDPLIAYNHNGLDSAVTGGSFPGAAFPASYANSYFFGDFAQDFINQAVVDSSNHLVSVNTFITGAGGPVDIETAPDGSLYYIAIYSGEIKRISYTLGNRQPTSVPTATPNSGLLPLTVAFSGLLSSDPDNDTLKYAWNFGDGATSSKATTTHKYTIAGAYDVVLTVTDGRGGVDIKSVRITAGNQKPTATIVAPLTGSFYRMGQSVNLVATGTDPDTGTLPSSAFAWHVLLHHDGHVHYLTDLVGKNASFPGPDHENPIEIWVEVQLTVTDAAGLTDTKSVNIYLDPSSVTTTNLIANPSLELSTASTTLPDGWTPNTYLNTTARFTYPVAGIAGARAAQVDITARTSGDAKWIFTPVAVTPGIIYTYSESYMASVPSYVLFDIGLSDGSHIYPKVGDNIPAVGVWTPFTASYQLPANAVTLSVFHYIDSVGSLTIDNTSLTPPAGAVTPPTTTNLVQNPSMENATANPSIPDHWFTNVYLNNTASFIYPIAGSAGNSGAKVSITAYTDGDAKWIFEPVAVTPNATYTFSDKYLSNITSHVWLDITLIDGTHTYVALNDNIPAALNWTSFTATYQMPANAAFATVFHLISGVGELTTDEYSLTPPGTVTPPPTTNLIANPSFELSTASTTLPDGWTPNTYLNTTARFTYPVAGTDGARAAQVDITARTSGDAKWIFTPVSVIGNTMYTYSESYLSTVPSDVLLDIGLADGTHLYPKIGDRLPARGVWTNFTATYDLPANAVTLAVFHLIDSVGSLTIDNTSLTPPGTVTPPPTTNLVQNPSMESAVANPAIPDYWFTNVYLNNTANFTYPVSGTAGNSAAKVAITAHTDGDAKWIFEPVAVTPNTTYTFSDKYLSNVTSHVWVDVTLADGTHSYAPLNDNLPAAAAWTTFSSTYSMPVNAIAATIFHLIAGVGELTTDEYTLVAN